jgi:hypothetical protein
MKFAGISMTIMAANAQSRLGEKCGGNIGESLFCEQDLK